MNFEYESHINEIANYKIRKNKIRPLSRCQQYYPIDF